MIIQPRQRKNRRQSVSILNIHEEKLDDKPICKEKKAKKNYKVLFIKKNITNIYKEQHRLIYIYRKQKH